MFEDAAFDIFREFIDGSTVWIASVRALQDAEAHMNLMAWQRPGKYFVWHGNRQIAHVDTTLRTAKSAPN
ncbi:MAG TPA: hypothetical protein VIY69_06250 [Candidatus Acidoferrales bacterium]